jgi:hypothetical protein
MTSGNVSNDPPRLRSEADAAWDRYRSTCFTGGTAEQRRWSCDQAVKLELAAQRGALAAQAARRTASAVR